MTKHNQYHLQFFGPLKNEYVDWGPDAVSVYRIDGHEIASRTIFNDQLDPHSGVKEAHPWPGFIGCFNTVEEAYAAIAEDRAKP